MNYSLACVKESSDVFPNLHELMPGAFGAFGPECCQGITLQMESLIK